MGRTEKVGSRAGWKVELDGLTLPRDFVLYETDHLRILYHNLCNLEVSIALNAPPGVVLSAVNDHRCPAQKDVGVEQGS